MYIICVCRKDVRCFHKLLSKMCFDEEEILM